MPFNKQHCAKGECERQMLRAENRRLRVSLEAIVNEYGRDPETVHIPAKLIAAAEAALSE